MVLFLLWTIFLVNDLLIQTVVEVYSFQHPKQENRKPKSTVLLFIVPTKYFFVFYKKLILINNFCVESSRFSCVTTFFTPLRGGAVTHVLLAGYVDLSPKPTIRNAQVIIKPHKSK